MEVDGNSWKAMQNEVEYFWYLEERSWFMNNSKLQTQVWNVVRSGLGNKIVVAHPEFQKHIEELLENEEKKDCKSE